MTSVEGRAESGRRDKGPDHTPRLRLKPKAPVTGHVDGAWWPHSEDLVKELPDLLAVLAVRLGGVDRVLYNLAEWSTAPARLQSEGREIRLDGYHSQPAHTLEVIGKDRDRILLLVVPSRADPDLAHDTLMSAAAPGDTTSVDNLLTQ